MLPTIFCALLVIASILFSLALSLANAAAFLASSISATIPSRRDFTTTPRLLTVAPKELTAFTVTLKLFAFILPVGGVTFL